MANERKRLSVIVREALVDMCEGNPGAASVIGQLLEHHGTDGLGMISILDDMNIRGSQIWVAYKYFAGEQLDLLVAAIRFRSPVMIDKVNEMVTHVVAVRGGAIKDRAA